jgi:hypothetical protein
MSATQRPAYVESINEEYQALRAKQKQKTDLLSLDDAKKKRPNLF